MKSKQLFRFVTLCGILFISHLSACVQGLPLQDTDASEATIGQERNAETKTPEPPPPESTPPEPSANQENPQGPEQEPTSPDTPLTDGPTSEPPTADASQEPQSNDEVGAPDSQGNPDDEVLAETNPPDGAPIDRSGEQEPASEPAPDACPQGQSRCATACVSLQTDTKHCGTCNNACSSGQGCFAGRCLRTSKLWGKAGESFAPTGRMMDWSYAGYEHGNKALPTHKPDIRLTDYGAIADDGKDDTAAFEKALAALPSQGGTLRIPTGTFILRKRLRLNSGVVIQGTGPSKTIISIPVSLTSVYGNNGLQQGGTSSYSFSGGFFEIRGSSLPKSANLLATVNANAKRGSKTLQVQDASRLKTGVWVLLAQTDANRTLMNRLHADLMKAGDDNVGDTWTFPNQIKAINGNTLTFERALPLDVETRWKPSLYKMDPLRHHIGIEHLRIAFPATNYPGHFKEQGYNAIDFYGAQHSWVRDVHITNADYGVNLRTSYNITVADVHLISKRKTSLHGHHGLNIGHGADHLLIGFNIDATFQHDITVEWYSTGNVITKGKGRNIRMDHHRAAPYLTLWTQLDLGLGTTPWVSGGRSDRGPHTAAYSTYWNLTAKNAMALPANNYGPRMNFIGYYTTKTSSSSPYDWWLETIPPQNLGPPNLWEAMRQRRLGTP